MWRVELFGEPRLVGYGQIINRFESKRAVALLAYLALHPNTRHPREVLADRIWPDAPLESARNRLKQALASLRRVLEPPTVSPGSVLDADRAAVGLRAGAFCVDVDEFRSLVSAGDFAAAALVMRGELLPGFYDEWLEDIRLELSSFEYELESASPAATAKPRAIISKQRIHIPAAISSFVGRERECQEIADALSRNRWVTVTGFGGVGKTRTTQQVGRNWAAGDVFFVPLASLDDVRQIPYSIFTAMGTEPPTGDPVKGLELSLSDAPTLLILDNAEKFPSQSFAQLLVQLLEDCPHLRILVSSRIPFRSTAEAVHALQPLPVPVLDAPIEVLATNESVKLFIDRARNARPDFQLTPSNTAMIATICNRLEGSPLAIELCAAWSRLGTSVLLARLEQGQAILSARSGGGGGRHESTAQVFESTCDLLSEGAVRLLGELSLFRSGFELPLLDYYCSPAPTPEAMSELIEASLVVPVYDSDPERFFLLESIRQHAEALLTVPEIQACTSRFVAYFAELASQAMKSAPNPGLGIQDQRDWVRFLLRNWGCFSHAAQLASETDVAQAETIVLGTEWFWSLYVPNPEIVRTLQTSCLPNSRVLEVAHLSPPGSGEAQLAQYDAMLMGADEQLKANILLQKAKLKVRMQDMAGVQDLARQAADGFRKSGDQVNLGLALHILYNAAIQAGERELGEQYRAEAERCFRQCGSLVNLAALVYTQCRELYILKEYEAALSMLYRCRDIAVGLQSMRFMGRAGNLFGVVLRHLGDEAKARVFFYLSLVASLRTRDTRGSHIPMWNLFLSLGSSGRYREGVVVMGYAMCVFHEHFGQLQDPQDEALLRNFVSQAKESLGPTEFASLESEGRRLTLEVAERLVSDFLKDEIACHKAEVKAFFVDLPLQAT